MPAKDKTGKRGVGKPKKFTVEEFEQRIEDYFLKCAEERTPFTITGLALALDTTRKTLCDYEKYPEYCNAIKRAKTRVENFAEIKLYSSTPTGAIFALKNFGWSDKPVIDEHDEEVNPIKVEINVKDARKPDADTE